jgi:hypothetical protein
VFSDLQSAVAVMHALNGMVFDLEKHSTLHIDLAKSNPKSKRSRTDDGWESLKKLKSWNTTTESGKIIGTHLHLEASCNLLYFMFLVTECLCSIYIFKLPIFMTITLMHASSFWFKISHLGFKCRQHGFTFLKTHTAHSCTFGH